MKIIKRTLHLFISAAVIFSGVTNVKAEETDTNVPATAVNESYLDYLKSIQSPLKRSSELNYEDDDVVTIIVELKDKPLLDHVTSGSVEAFLKSARSATLETKIEISQDVAIESIENKIGELSIEGRYSTVVNGFSFKTEYRNLKSIREVSNVKRAFVALSYEMVEPQMDSSTETVGANSVWEDAHLKGEGIVVGVLDTGLDLEHEAFQQVLTEDIVEKSDVEAIMNANELSAKSTTEGLSVNDVYQSTKVPFAYDYADKDANVSPENAEIGHNTAHGTHVAGTVAGKADGFSGVAPNAQLMIFKVFSDIGGTTNDSIILSALDDAVKLNVDVINMSLGSDGGFSSEGEGLSEDVYGRLHNAGIILDVSAGNANNAAQNNGWFGTNLAPAADPDHGLVGRPSTYDAPLSIASVDNTKSRMASVLSNGRLIAHTTTSYSFKELDDVEYEYVVIGGVGSIDDYLALEATGVDLGDLEDKILIVQRGEINFTEKMINAQRVGAKGVLIYNNAPGALLNMADDGVDIPGGFISLEDGEFLAGQSVKTMTISQDDHYFPNDLSGGKPSSFSSMGTTNELRIKPELAAPGGNIYSSYPSQTGTNYSTMSGTSMASPHVAGASALVKQYLKATYPEMSDMDIVERVNQLLMSTAHPVEDVSGPYSVRKQGAGVFNVNDAINTPAFLSVDLNKDGTQRSKLELGDDVDKTGVYTLKFNVTNTSNSVVDYAINTVTTTPAATNVSFGGVVGNRIMSLDKNALADTSVSGDTTISVNPGETKSVEISVALSVDEKEYLDMAFENGAFVEGFVTLTPTSVAGNDVKLSIPFLGFYGDWEQPGIFDHASWFEDIMLPNNFINQVYTDWTILGGNLIDPQFEMVNKKMLSISPNGDEVFDGIEFALISQVRNARSLNYTITNKETGEIVYEFLSEYSSKSMFRNSAGRQVASSEFNLPPAWRGENLDGNLVADGVYEYKIEADLGYRDGVDDVYSFDVAVDTKLPTIENNSFKIVDRDGRTYLETVASDDNYLIHTMVAPVVDKFPQWNKSIVRNYTPNEAVSEHLISIDVTDHKGKTFAISLLDNAMNEQVFYVSVPNADKTEIQLPFDFVTLKVGETFMLTVSNVEAGATLTWSSDNEDVVTIQNDGMIEAIGTGQTKVHVRDAKGNHGEMLVGVYDDSVISALNLTFTNLEIEEDSRGLISVASVTPFGTFIDDSLIEWTSSDVSVIEITGENGIRQSVHATGSAGERAVITAKYLDVEAHIDVEIVASDSAIASTTLFATSEVNKGQFITLHAEDRLGAEMEWSIEDDTILRLETINSNLVRVHGLEIGNTKVIARSENGEKVFNVAVIDSKNKYKEVHFEETTYQMVLEEQSSVRLSFGETTSLPQDNVLTHKSYDERVATYDGTSIVAVGVGETIVETILQNGARDFAYVKVSRLDNQDLVELISLSKGFIQASYTEASYAQLLTAQISAQSIVDNPNASSRDISVALVDLQAAIDGLKQRITGLQKQVNIPLNGSVILNPNPSGGTWDYDASFFSVETLNSTSRDLYSGGTQFTALKAGTTSIRYTVNGDTFTIDVVISEINTPIRPKPDGDGGNTGSGDKPGNVDNDDRTSNTPGSDLPNTGVQKASHVAPIVMIMIGLTLLLNDKRKRKTIK